MSKKKLRKEGIEDDQMDPNDLDDKDEEGLEDNESESDTDEDEENTSEKSDEDLEEEENDEEDFSDVPDWSKAAKKLKACLEDCSIENYSTRMVALKLRPKYNDKEQRTMDLYKAIMSL